MLLILSFVICLVLTKVANVSGFRVAETFYPALAFLDPDRVFIELILHHLFQALIALGAIMIFRRRYKIGWEVFGFSWQQFPSALRAVMIFVVIWTVIQVSLSVLWIYVLKREFSLPFNPTLWNTAGRMLFQLGFSGLSEELLYRALNLTVLLFFARKAFAKENVATAWAVILSLLIFMVDHVNFTLHPTFAITYINWPQQVTLSIFGLFYAWIFLRFRTIYAPMLAHSLLNCVIELSAVLLFVTYPI